MTSLPNAPPADPVPETAIVPRSERMEFGAPPATWRDAFDVAHALAKSSIVPKAFQGRPEDVLVAMAYGAELHLPPLAALQSIAVVNGKPALYADGFLGVIVASPAYVKHAEYFITADGTEVDKLSPADLANDETTAVSKFWRRGIADPFVGTFSIGDAKRAGLLQKSDNWKAYPQRMLQWRARGFAGRNGFAPELRGLKMSAEVEDYGADRIEAPINPPIRRSEKAATAPVSEPTPDPAPPPRQAPPPAPRPPTAPPTPPPPTPRQARPTPVIEASTADVVITETAMIQPRGLDPFYEVSARVAAEGKAPLAYKFVCRDKDMFDLAASAEGSERLFTITWTKGTRHDGSPCKILESIGAAD